MVKHDTESANNFILLQEFYPLIQDTRQYAFGAQAYRNAFDYHLETYPGPPDPDDDDSDAGEEGQESNTMELQHILCLVDMLLQIEKLEEGVDVVRRGMRWLQGRGEQKYWDIFDDDREYTTDPKAEEAFDLDIALRHRLALLRLRLGNDSDAFVSHSSRCEGLGGLTDRNMWKKSSASTWWPIRKCLSSWGRL